MLPNELAIHALVSGMHPLESEPSVDELAAALADATTFLRRHVAEPPDLCREAVDVAGRHQRDERRVVDDLAVRRDVREDGRTTRRHRLDHGDGEPLAA